VVSGLAVNVALWQGLGSAVFWMWWNLSGLVVAAAVTAGLSRLPGLWSGPMRSLPPLPAREPLPRAWVLAAWAATGLIALLLLALPGPR